MPDRTLANSSWSSIGEHLEVELRSRIVVDQRNGLFNFAETGLGGNAGFTTQMMGSSFLWMRADDHVKRSVAIDLAISASKMQKSNGGIVQPYNVLVDEEPLIDVVEFGAAAGNLAYLARESGDSRLVDCLVKGSEYLLEQRVFDFPGAILKNPKTVSHDVINASAYAANAWAHTFGITQKEIYYSAMLDSVNHVIGCWSSSESGWWNYAERWDRSVLLGRSVSYQASILALIGEIAELFPARMADIWNEISEVASASVVEALHHGSSLEHEVPTWSRDWSNVFEIDWFLARFCNSIDGAYFSELRLNQLKNDLISGDRCWSQGSKSPNRSLTSTDFRKIANLSGAFVRIMPL